MKRNDETNSFSLIISWLYNFSFLMPSYSLLFYIMMALDERELKPERLCHVRQQTLTSFPSLSGHLWASLSCNLLLTAHSRCPEKENECHVCWWRLTLACKALIRERSRASASLQRIALFFIRACSKRLIRQDVTERASSSLVSICWPFPCSYLWANIKIETEDDRKHVPIP